MAEIERLIAIYEDLAKTDDYAVIILTALQEKAERDNPKPLTFEELEKMCKPEPNKIYEPIWIHSLYDNRIYCVGIINVFDDYVEYLKLCQRTKTHMRLSDYGNTWLAYAHKPESEG